MKTKTAIVTVRLTEADQEFLTGMSLNGATTPSEKLRALISEARLRKDAVKDFRAALRLVSRLLEPAVTGIRVAEKEHHQHSQLIHRIMQWLPDMLATVVAEAPDAEDPDPGPELRQLEGELAKRVLRLFEAVLQLAITRDSGLYDPEILGPERLEPVLKLSKVVGENQ